MLSVGDAAPPRVRAPILRDYGPPRWHALLVFPRREQAAKDWLDARGVYAFFPVSVERRMVRRYLTDVARAYLPGYLFARFHGEVAWHRVLGSPFIHNALRRANGEPGLLHPETLESLREMRTTDDKLAERRANECLIRRGCKVRVISGPFQEWEVEVTEITTSGRAKFEVKLLGGTVGECALDALEFVRGPEA
jgi:transcription antitermination factor NusG